MKVLYLLHQTYAVGGANRSFLSLVRELRRLGVEVHVAMPDQEGIYQTLVADGFKTLSLPFRHGTYPDYPKMVDRLLYLPRLVARRLVLRMAVRTLSAYVKQHDINLIHSNSSVLDLGFYLSRKTDRPHVMHIREYGDSDFGYIYYPNWPTFHRHFDWPHQYSICITRDVQRHHGLAERPDSWVIYNGISHRQSACPKVETQPYFLYVGRIQETKGLEDVVSAYVQYTKAHGTSILLKIAGMVSEEDYYKRILNMIRTSHLDSNVEFLGEVTDVAPLMNAAQALIVPSRSEGFGRCMVEGMFCGCPVIVRNAAGLAEQLTNGRQQSGRDIALSYNTIEQLVQCMESVLSMDAIERESLVQTAFQTANDLYSVESCAQRVFAIYKEILR